MEQLPARIEGWRQGRKPQPPDAAGTRGVDVPAGSRERLTASDRGLWLVRTRNTEHVFDLDRSCYTRHPTVTSSNAFPHDNRTLSLTRVERWPAVGSTFFIWLDDPEVPDRLEYWRQSSTVASITPLPRDATTPAEGPLQQ